MNSSEPISETHYFHTYQQLHLIKILHLVTVMFNELTVIRDLKSRFKSRSDNVILGIGDDCAAVKPGSGLMLYSTDTVTEGIHFLTSYMTCREIAAKSVSAAVSDIAAMGGTPLYFLSTLGIPKCFPQNNIDELLEGFGDSSELYGIELVGGNISGSDKLFIDITVIGEVEKDMLVSRKGASEGDTLFVTGTLGDSSMGLELLKTGKGADDGYLENSHKQPQARTDTGKMLAENYAVSSMIDISDGFLIDLERITLEKGLGADIYLERLPLSDQYVERKDQFKEPLSFALSGGEDYELLFTASAENVDKIKEITNDSVFKFQMWVRLQIRTELTFTARIEN